MENSAIGIMKSFEILTGLAALAGIVLLVMLNITITLQSISLPWLALYSFIVTFVTIKLIEENPKKNYYYDWIFALAFGAFIVALLFI